MQSITTKEAPLPAGHYAQAIACNGLIFVSGQLPIHVGGGGKEHASIEEQTRQALLNLDAVLEKAGSGKDRVLKTTVYISDIQLWDRVDRVYSDFFGAHRPARSVVPTRDLHYGYQIEVEAIAALHDTKDAA